MGAKKFDYTTSNLPGLAKTWVRSDISVFSQTGSGNTAYPTDTMIERPLPTNCFAVTNGSSQVEVTYASQDATYFANKVGKKVQLNVPNPTVVVILISMQNLLHLGLQSPVRMLQIIKLQLH